MPLCKACGENPDHHHCLPFCPRCGKQMQSHRRMEKEGGHTTQLYTYYVCPVHGKQKPKMRDLCPLCGAEIEVEKKIDEFKVDPHGPSGRLAHPFMYNYYMQGLRRLDGAELIDVAITPINSFELREVFDTLVNKGVFTVERELKIVKIDPDALEQAKVDGFVELRFVEMLRELKDYGFLKENPHIAMDVKKDED